MSSFSGIEISTRALQAFQHQLDVTGHNIANVNTPGYSRQVVDLQASTPELRNVGKTFAFGTGVDVTSVNRIRDAFLDARRITVQSASAKVGQEQIGMQQVADSLNEPSDNGVSAAMTKFFDAWSGLAGGTGTTGAQTKVQAAATSLTQRVRDLYGSLQSQQSAQADTVTQDLKDLQTKINSIDNLNTQIRDQKVSGAEANDLMDKRQKLIDEVCGLVNVSVIANPNGTVSLHMGQLTLVDEAGARKVPTTFDSTTGAISDSTGTYPILGGKIAGEASNVQRIESYKSDLDKLANTLKTSVNAVYVGATNSAGVTGKNFFNDTSPQTGAAYFSMTAAIIADPSMIAASTTGRAGDGDLALKLSGLRQSGQASLGGKSPVSFYGDLVNRIGQDAAFAKSGNDTQTALLQQVSAQIQSVSGVSLDDEMANMLRFQRSYQAAAKALSMFDETTQSLLAIMK